MLKHATQDLDDEDCVYVSTTWTAVCSIYGARTPTPRPRKGRPQMTLPLLPTQNELCSKSKPPLQMLLSSLALRLASRRQRSFTSPCPRKNTTRPPSPSATQSWNQFSNSPSWAAPSHPMPWSTRKLTTDWQRVNSTFGRLYENVWNKRSLKRKTRSAFTELLHSLLSSMAPRHGSYIAATSKSSRVSIVVYGVSIGNKGMPPSISIKNKGFKMASKSLREDSSWQRWRHRTWHHSRWRFNISITCRCMRESTLRHPSEGGHLG